ncbi:MAG: cupin domain-containing protein [Ignavibacteriaceae bacterium]|nr:cupin domain-containing protein [Ignavibacteriaceae bacterium]
MHPKAKQYIKQLQLKKHPEGGYYKEVYRSGEIILPEHLPKRYKQSRNFSTSIYFLLEGKQFSSFHLLQSDELWHFYDGSNVLLYIINQKGELSVKKLGRDEDCELQLTIEKQNWFAAELEDKKSFALFGCTVSPGFDFADFELGKRDYLIKKFPQHSALIKRLSKPSRTIA